MLDEGLEVLTGLWSGEPFSFDGEHYHVREARHAPTPLQQSRIPIWVAGIWPHKRPFRRAAQWDGVAPLRADEQPLTPDDVRALAAYTQEWRTGSGPFEIVLVGGTGQMEPRAAADHVAALAEAGATWRQEGFLPGDTITDVRQRIRQGPPRA
jgi:alkanesulfonate monooxygenase SsuD/methylene tetrahydromethanopterin reductase-like flavin-dependent oxidoreductase (luciferase family)